MEYIIAVILGLGCSFILNLIVRLAVKKRYDNAELYRIKAIERMSKRVFLVGSLQRKKMDLDEAVKLLMEYSMQTQNLKASTRMIARIKKLTDDEAIDGYVSRATSIVQERLGQQAQNIAA